MRRTSWQDDFDGRQETKLLNGDALMEQDGIFKEKNRSPPRPKVICADVIGLEVVEVAVA